MQDYDKTNCFSQAYSSREEWISAREGSIGASEVSTVLGINKWDTPYKLWLRKMGLAPPVQSNEAMEIGLAIEDFISGLFMADKSRPRGIETIVNPGDYCIYKHSSIPFMHATLDRIVIFNGGSSANLQIKNVGQYLSDQWKDGAPGYVVAQVQAEMICSGTDLSYVAALIGGNKFVYDTVERDQDFCDKIILECREFWDCVKRNTPPPTKPSDAGVINSHLKTRNADPVAASQEVVGLTERIDENSSELLRIQKALIKDKNKLKELLGENELSVLPDGSGWSYKDVYNKGYEVAPSHTRRLRRLKPCQQ